MARADYRRHYVPGGTCFFTVVTYNREPLLTTPRGQMCLKPALQEVQRSYPFDIVAIVLLPNHLHAVWTLPRNDDRYPLRWARIKAEFTEQWLARGGAEQDQSASRSRHRYRGIWQKRYW